MSKIPNIKVRNLDCKQGAVRAVRFNADGDYCITCGSDKTVKLWNPVTQKLLQIYGGHLNEVLDAQGSFDSSRLTAGGLDKCVYLWDVAENQIIRRYHAHAAQVNCVKFNEESTVILSGSLDGTLKTWDCKSRSKEPIQVFPEAKDSITSIAVTDHEIAIASLDGQVRRYDMRKGIVNCDNVRSSVGSVCFTNDKQCLLISCLNNTVKLLDKGTGEVLNEYSSHTNTKYRIDSCLTANDSIIVSGSEDGWVYCWDLLENSLKGKLQHVGHRVVHSVCSHPKLNRIITAAEGSVYLWSDEELED